MANGFERDGIEESISKGKKITAMRRAIEILKYVECDDFILLAEKELGAEFVSKVKFEPIEGSTSYSMVDIASPEEQAMNRKILDRTREIENEVWEELWAIIKGNQDYSKFKKNQDRVQQFNGTDMRGWWD
jgi:ASC-1-like (ASCH) protein